MTIIPDLSSVVVIVDIDDNTYYSHREVGSTATCFTFVEGMRAAWDISHGPANYWQPFVLGNEGDRGEWERMGSPGRAEIMATLAPIEKKS